MDGLYEIEISYGEGYRVDERSGVYCGELKEILPRISDGISKPLYIKVKKIKVKQVDMNQSKKSIGFYCYDDELKKELNFCMQSQDEDYFVYIPEDTKRVFTFQDKILKEGNKIIFRDEYGNNQAGEILWFDHDNYKIKVLSGTTCYTVDTLNIAGVYA